MAAAFLAVTSGCHSVGPLWQPEEFLARAKPDVVYVRYRERPNIAMAVANPRLTGDTLHGTQVDNNRPVALVWADVLDVYARRLNSTRTVFAVSGLTLLSAITVYAFAQHANGDIFIPCEVMVTAYEHDRDLECLTR
jgi:hypothetical protein